VGEGGEQTPKRKRGQQKRRNFRMELFNHPDKPPRSDFPAGYFEDRVPLGDGGFRRKAPDYLGEPDE